MLSVIVCTYNRAKLLNPTFKRLINQTANKKDYEIIIVDNNSKDETKNVVNSFVRKYVDYKIKYIFEKNQGLSHARNAGCQQASADYLAYIDDDAKTDKSWIKNILKRINEIKPDILGGPIYPYYLAKKPQWFKDSYEIRTNGNTARFLKEGEYLSGSNFIIKKNLLEKLGGFDTLLGMKGDKLGYGEETKLMRKARGKIKNIKFFYDPEIKIKHLVSQGKMKLLYRIKAFYFLGKCAPRVFQQKVFFAKAILNFVKILLLIILKSFYGIFFRNKRKYQYYQNYSYEKISPFFYQIGKFFSLEKNKFQNPAQFFLKKYFNRVEV